jgi:uncharacterized protein (TIGR03083 family)
VEPAEHLAQLDREGRRFGDRARETSLDTSVPTCPGFDVGDLIWHLAVVHNFWTAVVERELSAPDQVSQPDRPRSADLVGFFERTCDRLVTTLTNKDPNVAVWTPVPPNDVGFVLRRVAHETTVHRYDLDLASLVTPRPVEALLAEDGIDEWVKVILQSQPDERIDLVIDETGRSWSLGDGPKPTAVVRGTAMMIFLAIWRRVPIQRLRIEGPEGLVVDFIAAARLLG